MLSTVVVASVVGTAGTAAQAIALAVRHRPQIILMDIRLAGPSDGIEAAIAILQKTGIRSIFATAHVDENTRTKAAAAQPLGWLPKPYNDADILAAVAAALLGRQ
jgi:DNA-binding NarL/FixJ family response regulator